MNDYPETYSFDEDKPKRKHSDDPTSWTQAWQAIGLFLGIIALVYTVSQFAYTSILGEKLATYYEILGTTNSATDMSYLNIYNSYNNPISLIGWLLLTLLISLVALFIVYGLIHFFATKTFQGIGTLRGLIVKANLWTIGAYLFLTVLSLITSFFLVNSLVANFAGMDIYATSENQKLFTEFVFTQLFLTYGVYGIAWLIWSIGMSRIISKNYWIGQGKGCFSLLLMNISVFALYCTLSVSLGIIAFMILSNSSAVPF